LGEVGWSAGGDSTRVRRGTVDGGLERQGRSDDDDDDDDDDDENEDDDDDDDDDEDDDDDDDDDEDEDDDEDGENEDDDDDEDDDDVNDRSCFKFFSFRSLLVSSVQSRLTNLQSSSLSFNTVLVGESRFIVRC
jgi:hypothetical protein